jgi:hypothetical protein
MTHELQPLFLVAFVVSATALFIVYHRMVNRLRPIHPFVRSNDYWYTTPNSKLYRLTFREDRRAMRLWYLVMFLRCLTVLLFVLVVITD